MIIPSSGTVIQKTDITAMHQTVRALINAEPGTALRPGALGPQAMGMSMVAAKYYKPVSTPVLLSTEHGTGAGRPWVENQAAILVGADPWQNLAQWLDVGTGFGWTIPASYLVLFWHARLSELQANNYLSEHQYWLNPYYILNSSDQTSWLNSTCLWAMTGASHLREEAAFCWFEVHDASSYTPTYHLNQMGLRGIKYRSSDVANSVPDIQIASGGYGFIALYK
ncbi:MAG: hypothetical protein WC869_08115 [Phycisphaerae bacterium]|jgi:hypothetical protein